MTDIEEKVKYVLDRIGFFVKDYHDRSDLDYKNTFYAQVPIGSFRVDFANFVLQIAIEVHGQYWHASFQRRINFHQAMALIRDEEKKRLLKEWTILEITESALGNIIEFEKTIKKQILGKYKV